MQTISAIHDISETGAEWEELREAMEELNRENAKEARERRRIETREKRIAVASRLFREFKNGRNQLRFF